VIATPKFYLISVYRFGMFFMTAVTHEAQPLLVIETQHRIVDVFIHYFDKVTESIIRQNFATVYQVLDEMIDGGYTSVTETATLKAMIAPPSLTRKLIDTVTGGFSVSDEVADGTGSIPWRSSKIKYIQNQIYVDQVEVVDGIVASNGLTVVCDVYGFFRVNCQLSGLPDLTMTFNRASLIDDVGLHRCVRINQFRNERVISFVPPDGKFKLMSYRVRGITEVPISVSPSFHVSATGASNTARLSLQVTRRLNKDLPIDGVVLTISMPSSVTSATLSANVGSVKTDPLTHETVWTIGYLPVDKTPLLEGSCNLSAEYSKDEKPVVRGKFSVKKYTSSGLAIGNLSVRNVKYKPTQLCKKITKAGNFEWRF
jgi:AP-3 complex subunit mu